MQQKDSPLSGIITRIGGHIIYSWKWAQPVVQRFVEKYARGTTIMAEIAGIDRRKLIEFMINCVRLDNQVEWIALKKMIKSFEHDNLRDYHSLPLAARRACLTSVKYYAESEAIDELDQKYRGLDTRPPIDQI